MTNAWKDQTLLLQQAWRGKHTTGLAVSDGVESEGAGCAEQQQHQSL